MSREVTVRRGAKKLRAALAMWLALTFATTTLVAYAFPEPPPAFQLKWGGDGSGAGQFTNLEFLAADSAGNIYASDAYDPVAGNHRIQKFSPDGALITQWGGLGSGPGQFTSITGLAIDANDRVYVVDSGPYAVVGGRGGPSYNRVQRFTSSGDLIDAPFQNMRTTGVYINTIPWLTSSGAPLDYVSFVVIDPASQDIWVGEGGTGEVRRYSPTGALLAETIGIPLPRAGVVDSTGHLYLSLNRGQGPIAKYSPAGVHIPPLIDMPGNQLAIDPDGNLYGTANNPSLANNVVRKFSPAGILLTEWGSSGTADGQFLTPSGLVRTPGGLIYVGEFNGKRVQRFGPGDMTAPTTTASAGGYASGSWSNTNVTVALSATDNPGGSGVKNITYSASGAQIIPSFTVPGASTSVPAITSEGITILKFYATDNAGNIEMEQSVTIKIDRTAPTASCSVSPSTLWPPNHKMVNITVSLTVTDGLSGDGTITLVSVTSNEPDNGLGDGDTAGDIAGWSIGTNDTTGQLRAERSGTGNGRMYTLQYEVRDQAGNAATTPCTVSVPKSR